MILVADSGSTNTDWVIIENNKIQSSFKTRGFNPYFTTSKKIHDGLVKELPLELDRNKVENIFFYGSGCSSFEMKNVILNGLQSIFKKSGIKVNHDLLGAARALFKHETGIAIILGTGANTCLYNGSKIEKNIPSLGFILGDEGGGDYLGKLFITELLYDNLPERISKDFLQKYKLTKSQILQKIYKETHPNQFLASICEYIHSNRSEKYLMGLVNKSFEDLFKKHITKYENYQNHVIKAVGSVAYYFEDFLKNTAIKFNARINHVEKNPITQLAEYHLKLK